MRYIGIDYGAKRTGIAISDLAGTFAFPREVLLTNDLLADRIAAYATEEGVTEIVLGDARTDSGAANESTPRVDACARPLEERGLIVRRGARPRRCAMRLPGSGTTMPPPPPSSCSAFSMRECKHVAGGCPQACRRRRQSQPILCL